ARQPGARRGRRGPRCDHPHDQRRAERGAVRTVLRPGRAVGGPRSLARQPLRGRCDVRSARPSLSPTTFDVKLERTWVEARWQPLLARAVTTLEHALSCARWRADTGELVALIGGSARVPMFQRAVAGVFAARSVTLAPRAAVAVALGTVLLAARFGAERR